MTGGMNGRENQKRREGREGREEKGRKRWQEMDARVEVMYREENGKNDESAREASVSKVRFRADADPRPFWLASAQQKTRQTTNAELERKSKEINRLESCPSGRAVLCRISTR